MLDETFTSDDDQKSSPNGKLSKKQQMRISSSSGSSNNNNNNLQTQEDSESAVAERNRVLAEKRIANIIKTLRGDAKEYLAYRKG